MSSNQIFISHEQSDETVAIMLKEFLESLHPSIEVFVAGRDLGGGEVWAEEIRLKLAEALLIISIITPYSTTSSWVLFETGSGFIERKSIPLLGDGLGISAIPSPYQILQARLMNLNGIRAILEDVANHIDAEFDIGEEVINNLVEEIDGFFQMRRDSVPSSKEEEDQEPDEELAGRLIALVNRSKAAVLARFESARGEISLPSAYDLDQMGIISLFTLAIEMKIGWSTGVSLNIFQLLQDPPLASDPSWKKENFSRKLDEIEAELSEYE